MPTSYPGLDVHKVRTQYCLMDPGGEILAEDSLPTEEVGASPNTTLLTVTGSGHELHPADRPVIVDAISAPTESNLP